MLRRLSLGLVLLAILCFMAAGCGDSVESDIEQYLTQQKALAEKVTVVQNTYSRSAVKDSDADFVKVLDEEVIPPLKQYRQEIAAVKVETGELKEVHQIWLDAMDLYISATEKLRTAVQKSDSELLQKGNDEIEQANRKFKEYEQALKALGEKHNWQLNY